MNGSKSLPVYSPAEEIANSVSHGIGWMLSAGGLGLMVTLASLTGGATRIVSVAVFCTSLILMYGASTMYHALTCSRAKRVFRVLDHSAIYLLIAGTYTPLALIALGGRTGWALFGAVWVLAAVGLAVSVPSTLRWKWLEILLYLVMGWLALLVVRPLFVTLGAMPTTLIFAGGIAYTGGLIFYGWKSLRFSHLIWHLFVLAGSILHFLAILFSVAV